VEHSRALIFLYVKKPSAKLSRRNLIQEKTHFPRKSTEKKRAGAGKAIGANQGIEKEEYYHCYWRQKKTMREQSTGEKKKTETRTSDATLQGDKPWDYFFQLKRPSSGGREVNQR